MCARFRLLLADADAVFDPAEHSDRLLLGLHGMMSEAELHALKQRMYQGRLNKARRRELFSPPPIGYVRADPGGPAISPDEQVRAVVRLISDRFDREATRHGLLRHLVHHQARIPVRVRGGSDRDRLEGRRPNRATVQSRLRHPSYAGAYRCGHRPTDRRKKRPGRPTTGTLIRRPDECPVPIRDRLPADTTRDRFQANQDRLTADRDTAVTPGAPRNGPALLAGLVRCGRCNRRMVVRYLGPTGRPSYTCTRGASDYADRLCQSLADRAALDARVVDQLLAAVQPDAQEAVAGVERERGDLARQWHLKRSGRPTTPTGRPGPGRQVHVAGHRVETRRPPHSPATGYRRRRSAARPPPGRRPPPRP